MGAGASAGIAAAVKESSPKQLEELLAGLNPDTRARIQKAVSGDIVIMTESVHFNVKLVLLSGEPVNIDLTGVEGIPQLRQAAAEHLKVSAAAVQLTHGGQVVGDDMALASGQAEEQVLTIVLKTVDLTKVRLEKGGESECDEGTAYSTSWSKLFYEDTVLWSFCTSVSSNIGGARGTSHTSTLSEDNATLIVKVMNETRSLGQHGSDKIIKEEVLSVEQLILEAQKKPSQK
mmetsp:Transcript_92268/g.161473  ORF Transcript_92268/g.161473 Transcript_92268/m.161473 type:complete len:232 (+) Transcript_92268:66-761(+)